jgi:hypothetical protein
MLVTLETNFISNQALQNQTGDSIPKKRHCNRLSEVEWDTDIIGVLVYWNAVENKIFNIVDAISPSLFFVKQSKRKQRPKTN